MDKLRDFEIVHTRSDGFQVIALEPPCAPTDDEVIVRPMQVGICGSDLFLLETREEVLRLGHEWIGRVESTGPLVAQINKGDIVTSTGTLACLKCEDCLRGETNFCSNAAYLGSDRVGALRSWILLREGHLKKVSAHSPRAALLCELAAVGQEAVHLLSNERPMEADVLIFGGGPVGIMTAWIAKKSGYQPLVVERLESRVRIAKALGLKTIALAEALFDTGLKGHYSKIIDTTNDYSGDRGAFRYLPHFGKKGFRAVVVAKYIQSQSLPPAYNALGAKLVWMRGMSHACLCNTVQRWEAELAEIAEAFITHVFPARQAGEAFDKARNRADCLKVVIDLEKQ